MRRLLIFLKEPQPGRVKTRLARQVGDVAASHVARTCAELLCKRLRGYCDQTVVRVHPPAAVARVQAWLGGAWQVQAQQGRTLGARLCRAVEEALQQGIERVLILGTDSPWLTPATLEEAFEALRTSDVVLGPTEDGGYYLIGVRGRWPALFQRIAWGTSRVCAQTQARARRLGLSVHVLRPGYDIDRYEDWQRFLHEAATGAKEEAG